MSSDSAIASLPPELWAYTLAFCSKRTLLSLCLTSKPLLHVAQPLLFRSLPCTAGVPPSPESKPYKQTQQLAAALLRAPDLWGAVHALNVVPIAAFGWRHIDLPPAPALPLHHLARMANLHTLALRGIRLPRAVLAAAQTLPRLRTLLLKDCSLLESSRALWDVPSAPFAALRALTLSSPFHDRMPEALWRPPLAARGLAALTVQDGMTAAALAYVYSATPDPGTSALRSATLNLVDAPAFLAFLAVVPQLRSLALGIVSVARLSLPPGCVPRLEAYRGPASLAPAFVQGRPVRSVVLERRTSGRHGSDVWDAVALLGEDVRELSVFDLAGAFVGGAGRPKWDGAHLMQVARAVPRLHKLGLIAFLSLNDLIDWTREFLAQLTELHTIEIRWPEEAFSKQLGVLQWWRAACPSLRTVMQREGEREPRAWWECDRDGVWSRFEVDLEE